MRQKEPGADQTLKYHHLLPAHMDKEYNSVISQGYNEALDREEKEVRRALGYNERPIVNRLKAWSPVYGDFYAWKKLKDTDIPKHRRVDEVAGRAVMKAALYISGTVLTAYAALFQ